MCSQKLVFLPCNGPFRECDFNSDGKDPTRSFTMPNLKRQSESIRTRIHNMKPGNKGGKLKAGIKKAGNRHLVPRELPPNCFHVLNNHSKY